MSGRLEILTHVVYTFRTREVVASSLEPLWWEDGCCQLQNQVEEGTLSIFEGEGHENRGIGLNRDTMLWAYKTASLSVLRRMICFQHDRDVVRMLEALLFRKEPMEDCLSYWTDRLNSCSKNLEQKCNELQNFSYEELIIYVREECPVLKEDGRFLTQEFSALRDRLRRLCQMILGTYPDLGSSSSGCQRLPPKTPTKRKVKGLSMLSPVKRRLPF